MAKNKYGIFDNSERKIVGILNINDEFSIEINGENINPKELLMAYNGCDITITVNDKAEDMI